MPNNHISKLYLFAKDTDANETIKGFKYQELKTLETWLFNRIHGKDEHIFCDYEEDIFQRDLENFKSTFRQIKLYSSKNFSFSSKEVKKALAHFFILFVKEDYLTDDCLFVFETNVNIAAARGDNDSTLLQEWVENQGRLKDELLEKCIIRLKKILNTYIEEQYATFTKENSNNEAEAAKKIYEELDKNTWEKFTNNIRWEFANVSADKAIEDSINNSMDLIAQLPFPLSKDENSLVFDRLRGTVGDKSMANDIEEKCLTNELLNYKLLSLGDDDDKEYIISHNLWKNITEIGSFNIGEFYQVLFSAKHCRRNRLLEENSKVWKTLLNKHIENSSIIPKCKREAIYELILLTLRPSLTENPKTNLIGLESLVIEYFNGLESNYGHENIRDFNALLILIANSRKLGLINLDEKLVNEWINQFEKFIKKEQEQAKDSNSLCLLLETEAFFYLNKNALKYGGDNIENSKKSLETILQELPNTSTYPISHLSKQIDEFIKILIKVGKDATFLEDFSEKIMPLVQSREGNFSTAKLYINKGCDYLESNNKNGIIKALNYFHKAKELYFDEATYEGYVLSLLNIAQLYSAIGMCLAARYYLLGTIWFCFNIEDGKLFKKIADAYSLLLNVDFRQGSWLNAIESFHSYLKSRHEFVTTDFDPITDKKLMKGFVEISYILSLMPSISPQLSQFVEYQKSQLGYIYDDFIKDLIEYMDVLQSKTNIVQILEGKLLNQPINDIGSNRIISWKAFGSIWDVKFPNDYLHNSVAEEFCALIQIIQTDIALSEIDFHLTKGEIIIIVEVVEEPKAPKQMESNSQYVWVVYIPVLNSKESEAKNAHYTAITVTFQMILEQLSLLPSVDYRRHFSSLFEGKHNLSQKALFLNAYQRMYRYLNSKEEFDKLLRDKFTSTIINIEQYESAAMYWISKTSPFYDKSTSIKNIESRYKNCLKSIYLTLNRIKNDLDFKQKISELKVNGLLDWQIIFVLYNNILDLKAKYILQTNGKIYSNDEEWVTDFQKTFNSICGKDEKEVNIEISVSDIIGEGLDFQVQQISLFVLQSFGLEDKSKFPNHKAIHDFLNNRFHFNIDDEINLSPLIFLDEDTKSSQTMLIEKLLSLNTQELLELINQLQNKQYPSV